MAIDVDYDWHVFDWRSGCLNRQIGSKCQKNNVKARIHDKAESICKDGKISVNNLLILVIVIKRKSCMCLALFMYFKTSTNERDRCWFLYV